MAAVTVYPTKNDVLRFRAAESFAVEGRSVAQGAFLERDDPLVALVIKKRPELLLAYWRRKEGVNA
jgi:hypothetical protein